MNDFHTTSRDSPAGATARVTARVLARGGIARVFFGGFAVLATVGFAARGLALIDDAYITLVYARNLGEGIGPVFNAGERVEGCTAFLQMLLLAPFAMLGLDLRVVTVVVSLAALALVATLVRARILADPSTDAKATEVDRRAADFAFVAVIANPALVHYALSGMETMWYAAAVLLAVLMAERDEDATPAAAAVMAAIAALLRPDGLGFAAALGLTVLLLSPRRRIARAAAFAAIFAALYLPFFFWRWSYYGFPFPNTYYAKVDAPSLALFSNGLRYTLRGIVDLIVPALAILLAVARRAGGARFGAAEKRILVVVGVVLAQIAMQGGDFLPYARFVIPIYPLFVLLAWRCARPLIETRAASRGWDMAGRRARMTAPAAAIALCFVTNFPSLNELQMLGHIAMVRTYEERARDLDEIVPEDAVIAADAIGAVKFITRLRVLDLLGLTDEVIAHTDVPTGEGLPGHEKTNVPYVLNRAPDVIFLCVRDSVRPLSACSARDFGFVPTLDRFQDSERFQHMYEYASHRVDGAFLSTYVLKANLDDAGWRRWVVVKNARELQRESLDETGGPGGGADGP